ncbi:MAG: TolC family protein [Bacteroidota bacterium]
MRSFLCLILPCLLSARPLVSQLESTSFGQAMQLSLKEAVQMALEKNRSVAIGIARIDASDAKVQQAQSNRMPQLRFSSRYTRFSEVEPFSFTAPFSPIPITIAPTILDGYSMRLTLSQPLFTGFRLQNLSKAAQYGSEAAREESHHIRSEVVFDVTSAYWNLYRAIDTERVLNETIKQIIQHLTDVQNFASVGMATTNDVLKVQVQLSEVQLKHIEARNSIRLAMIHLNNLLNLPLETVIHPSEKLAEVAMNFPGLPTLVSQALERRPDVRSMEYRVKMRDANLSATKGGWFPQVYLQADYDYARPNPRVQPIKDEWRDTWDVGVMFQFTLWDWFNTASQASEAKAELEEARQRYDQTRDLVKLDVTRSFLKLLEEKEKVEVAKQGAGQAQENYRITQSKFRENLVSNTELLDAEVALLQAKLNHTQSTIDHHIAVAALTKAIGEYHE